MKRRLITIALLAALLPLWAAADPFTGQCTSVSDGDTITVQSGRQEVKVRLHGIDCPEKDQPGGKEAKAYTERAVLHKSVVIHPTDTDRYGRTVAWVVVGGQSLNAFLVAEGHAWWYQKYAPRERSLGEYQSQAQKARRGLWAKPNPIPPWDWRKKDKGGNASSTAGRGTGVASAPTTGAGQVFIAPHSGKKWHARKSCRSLKNARSIQVVDRAAAEARSYGACGICVR